ncbi:MAG: class I SAM-dependent methyltransferase [Aquabacterium sp.]|uniref:class I SAM-dependent methyltransferase n=1 Tax=Aquabacterium sp. TaxID=1872578 RepID=UPI0025C6F2FA|nr:class I SAM-dependent methyltransferase [Aquabacterium sp.]MBI5925027.1 class I SAM-dependent methyltransferase [Aquabacterium sp.]
MTLMTVQGDPSSEGVKSVDIDVSDYDAVVCYLSDTHQVDLERVAHQRMVEAGFGLSEMAYFAVQEYYGRRLKSTADAAVRELLYREAYGKFTRLQVQKGSVDQGVTPSVVALARPLMEERDVLEIGSGNGGFAHQVMDIVSSYSFIEPSVDAAEYLINRIKPLGAPKHVIVGTVALLGAVQDEFDVIYCNDVYEHLHPDDAAAMVEACARKLRRSGRLILIASNKHFGPFDGTERYLGKGVPAAGLHINETSYRELAMQLKANGFSKVCSPPMPMSLYARLPQVIRRRMAWPWLVDARLKVLFESRWRFMAPYMATTSVVVVAER